MTRRFRGDARELIVKALGPSVADSGLDFEAIAGLVLGNLEALALNRIVCGGRREDPPEMVAALETIKKASELFLRYTLAGSAPRAARGG